MKKNILAFTVLTAATLAVRAGVEPYGVLPTAPHLAYHEREIIALVHWGLLTFTGGDVLFGKEPAEKVNPDRLDPEQWVVAMKAAEIKAVVLVAKHHDGFCLWPSKLCSDGYSVANASGTAKGVDLVKAVSDACRKHGLKFGCYLSPWDGHQASYGTPAYVDYFHAQWRELLTNYGEICEIWLDGANFGTGWYGGVNGGKGERRSVPADYYRMPQLLETMHELQPNAVAFNGGGNWSTTWCGTEAGRSPEAWRNVRVGKDGKKYWSPAECDTPLRRNWFFVGNDRPKSMARLVKTYFESVGHGAVLNFGIAPDTHGRVCDADVARLKEFGDWVREFNRTDFASGAVRTESGPAASRVITLKMPRPVRFNCCDIREEIRLGQRVESFVFEAKVNGAWRALARGTTIGSRRLGRFAPVVADEVRVTLKAAAEPVISTFALRFARRYVKP